MEINMKASLEETKRRVKANYLLQHNISHTRVNSKRIVNMVKSSYTTSGLLLDGSQVLLILWKNLRERIVCLNSQLKWTCDLKDLSRTRCFMDPENYITSIQGIYTKAISINITRMVLAFLL
jgi:hypothetical protein